MRSGVKKQSYIRGVMTLLVAQVVVKVLGLAYRLVITNMSDFGDVGNGLYHSGYQIYLFLLSICSMGIPSAMSKLISEKVAVGKMREAHQVFKISLVLFAILSGGLSFLLFFLANKVAYFMGNEELGVMIKVLSPGIFFVSIASVIRGYFSGMSNMKATSNSQMLEQFFKSVLIIVFVQIAAHIPSDIQFVICDFFHLERSNITMLMVVAANWATTFSAFLSCAYLMMFYKNHRRYLWEQIHCEKNKVKVRKLVTIKNILWLAIPISITSMIGALNKSIDNFTVVNCLKISLCHFSQSIDIITAEATRLYGILSGKIETLIGIPISFNAAFTIALVPAISSALASRDKNEVEKKIVLALRTTFLIALPCAVGLCVFAGPILKLLFPNAYSAESITLLQISSISIVFLLINQSMGGIFQGLGKVLVPAISLGFGAFVKLVLNLILIPRGGTLGFFGGINGAAISSLVAQMVACGINFGMLFQYVKFRMDDKNILVKPLIASLLMGGMARFSYTILSRFLPSFCVTVFSILLAGSFFLFLVYYLKIFKLEEVKT